MILRTETKEPLVQAVDDCKNDQNVFRTQQSFTKFQKLLFSTNAFTRIKYEMSTHIKENRRRCVAPHGLLIAMLLDGDNLKSFLLFFR